MRRILRKIAEGDTGNLGDTSTLADPAVVDFLVAAESSNQELGQAALATCGKLGIKRSAR